MLMLAVPLVILVGLGVLVRVQLTRIDAQSRFLADLQIQSLASLGNVSRTFSELRINVRSYVLATDPAQQATARALFDEDKANLSSLLRHYGDALISDERDRELYGEYRGLSAEWTAGAEKVLALVSAGRREEAVDLLNGPVNDVGVRLSSVSAEWIEHNERLAMGASKGAVEAIDDARRNAVTAVLVALALSGVLGFLTRRRIVNPIRALKTSVESIAGGDYAKEVPFTKAADETGELARSIDVLKDGASALAEQRWVGANVAKLMGELRGAASFAEFGQRLVSGLVPALGGGVAAVYLAETDPERLRRIATFGLADAGTLPGTFLPGEGLAGQCARERKTITLENLPPDYLRISSGLGGAVPAQALAWPLISREELLGVLEFASFRALTGLEKALVEEVLPQVGMSLDILARNVRTEELLARTQEQARLLEEQTEELTQSQEELLAQQEELRSSEEQFRTLLEAAPDALIISGEDGRIRLVNAQTEALFGYRRDELIGQPVEVLVPERLRAVHPAHRRGFHAAPSVRSMGAGMELSAVRKDGTEFPVEISLSPLPDVHGNGRLVCSSLRDITARKQLELEVHASEERTRLILESTAEGIFGVDPEGRITFVNPAGTAMLGYTPDELIGQKAHDIVHHHRADGSVYPVDDCPMYAAYAFGETSRVDDELLWHKDGTGVPVEYGVTPIRKGGAIMGAVVSFTDITERKRMEEEIRRQNYLADSALELTKAGYWHVPLDGSGWFVSSERAVRIYGDPPSPGYRYHLDHWAANVREGDEAAAKAAFENFNAALEGAIPAYDAVYAYKRPADGRVIWVHSLGHVVKDEQGKPTDMFGVNQDITDFKRLEGDLIKAKDAAEEATRTKSMFLANMSHEIRTPMNAIIGLSHLALKTTLDPKQRDYVSKIHTAGTSLLNVINDILDFSKIEAGKLDIETISFDIDDVISSVTVVTAQKAHEKGIEFLADVSPKIPHHLRGDPLRLGQVLTNLVNNAVKFTEHGEIRLKIELLEQTDERVNLRFSVRDTGLGMTPEQLAKLFQAFTQADMSTTRKHGGTGLGLTISQRLVELMEGRIWAESEAGVGSTFFFTVWLGLSREGERETRIPESLPHLNVLVADDNDAAREILADALTGIVGSVDLVSSGAEAVAAVKQLDASAPYDLVFMDWRMPGMDGLQAIQRIKDDGELHKQPAMVMVTAFGREEVRNEAERLGVDGFLTKPITKSMLVDTLVRLFADAGEGAAAAAAAGDESPTLLQGMRVLLAEDNEINQQIAVELLEGVGASVTVASNGREAVEHLDRGPSAYDVVLMDLQMPEMDGYQATRLIRSDARFAGVPVIAMTAHATVEEKQSCLAAGMVDHVAKPIDPGALFEALRRHYKPGGPPPSHQEGAAALEAHAGDGNGDIPPIEGLNSADGLRRVGGNVRLYRKLLLQSRDDFRTASDRTRELLASGDVAAARRLAHTIKGVAGNLGAERLRDVAAALEFELKGEVPGDVEAHLEALGSAAAELLPGLEALDGAAAAPQAAPQTSVDPALVEPVLRDLARCLKDDDMAAEAALKRLEELLGASSEDVARMRECVDNLEFAEALAPLARIAEALGIATDV
jgi:PAS domain S-box-containing protein